VDAEDSLNERFRHPIRFPLYLFTNNMSSDDVISHIIRKIVQNSTQLLKSESDKSKKLMSQSSDDLKEPAEQQQPINETSKHEKSKMQGSVFNSRLFEADMVEETEKSQYRTINELFLEEIHYVVKPFQITEMLAAFMIRAVVLNPDYGFRVENEMSRSEVDRLIKVCIRIK
jgi:hypothetical protein